MATKEALLRLIDALRRKDTEQDGNWGYPSFYEELDEIERLLTQAKEK